MAKGRSKKTSLRQRINSKLTTPVMLLIILLWSVTLTFTMTVVRKSLIASDSQSEDLLLDETEANTEPNEEAVSAELLEGEEAANE